MSRARTNNNSGFTLLELLLAVAIMSTLLVGLYAAFFSVSSAQVRIESELEHTRQIRRFMDVVSTELRSSFYKKTNERTLFESEVLERWGKELSSLGFTWFGYPLVGKSKRPASELVAVRYYVEEAPAGESIEAGAGVLFKSRWNPYGDESEGYKAEVFEDVESFALSFFDGKQWVKGWDASREGRLPAAVKIELTLRDGETVQRFSSIVRVIMGAGGGWGLRD